MPPCCAIVCLILGLAGIILFCVGFALPYWFQEPVVDGSSHGLWQTQECTKGQCVSEFITFGETEGFEAARIFSCATIFVSIIAFIFNIVLINKDNRVWAIRTAAVWGCTTVFNLLEAILFGVLEEDLLRALNLKGVTSYEDYAERLDWGYWVTIASLVIFFILTVSCSVLSCQADFYDDNDDYIMRKKLRNAHKNDKFHRLQPAMYPDNRSRDETSIKHPDIGRASNSYMISGNHIMAPSRPSNIDNNRIRLNGAPPNYMGASVVGDYSTIGSGTFVLNRPTVSPSSEWSTANAIAIQRSGNGMQDSVYSLNVSPQGAVKQNTTVIAIAGGGNLTASPEYSTQPRIGQPTVTYVNNNTYQKLIS